MNTNIQIPQNLRCSDFRVLCTSPNTREKAIRIWIKGKSLKSFQISGPQQAASTLKN